MTTTTHPSTGMARWGMLALISAGFIALTLNWFDVAAAFPLIGADFGVGLGRLSFLISLFLIGYGVAHIPGGMLATAIGMKKTLVIGLLVQGAAGVMSGLSYSYTELAIFRVISGIGGSIFIAVGFAAVMVWFHDRQVTLALGISGGGAFSAGAAFALFVWIYLQRATSWHTSLLLAGVFELVVAVAMQLWFRTPQDAPSLAGARFELAALRPSLLNRDLWIYGIALLGAYGAYFTTSQLFTEYAIAERGFDASKGGLLAAMIALAGIPGGILGGYLTDRIHNIRAITVGSFITTGVLLALIPTVSTDWLWVLGIGIGFFVIFGFAAWSAVPSRICKIRHEDLGTATGLMLSIAAIGGFFVPIIFGDIVPDTSYTTGWLFLAVISFAFALVGLLGRNPQGAPSSELPATPSTTTPVATI